MASEYDVVGAFQDIEMELIKSMKRTMKRHIGEEFQEEINWTQWQAEMLNGLAQYKAENADKLQGYYSTINEDIEEAIIQAYALGESEQEIELLKAIQEGFKADKTGIGTNAMQGSFFKINKEKLNALIKATTEDMSKAENAILRMTDDVYRQTIFKAQMFYNSGASTLWKAVDMATKDFLSAGINCVEYKNGARVNIASYSEMALRTANKRANLMGSANKRMEYGIHTVKITSHNSACPMCIQWQGKVYYDDVYGEVTPAERRGLGDYPLLSNAVKGGMFHPNCKNGLSTYYDGINQPPKEPTKEEIEEMTRRYNLEQRQRECERNIRKYKRLENGSLDADNIAKYAEKRRQWINEYNKLIASHTDILRAEPARLRLYGITSANTPKAIKSVSDASNFKDLQSYFKKKGYKMNDAIEKLDFNSVKDTTEGVDIVLNEFPQVKKVFAGFDIGKSGVACASFTGKISFNPAYYTDAKNLQSMIMGNTTGFHPKNTGIIEIGSHEMGHILELALINKHNGGVFAWSECTEAKKIVSEACKLAKKLPEGKGKVNATLKREISGYAMQNASECMAEGVADYIANKNNASVLSRMIWNLLKGELG